MKLYREALERTGDPEQAHREALSEYQAPGVAASEAQRDAATSSTPRSSVKTYGIWQSAS